MNTIFEQTVYVEKDGLVFQLHWKNRFEPVSMAMMVAGIGMSAYGQYAAGQQAAATADYNAKLQERQAQTDEQRAVIASRRQADEASRRMSSLRARMGASGVKPTSGTALAVLGEQAKQSSLENLTIGYEGQIGAAQKRQQAAATRTAGKSKKLAANIGAGTTLLTGFGNLAYNEWGGQS